VVIPARNEASNLPEVAGRIPARLPGVSRILRIVVDDGSADATGDVARELGCTVVVHECNQGTGAAMRTGCDAALNAGVDVIVSMDADGQHRPEDIPKMVDMLRDGAVDLVHGARSFSGQMPLLYRVGNHLLDFLMLLLFGLRETDTQCGFLAFRASAYPRLRWAANDYAVVSEIWVRAARAGLGHAAIPIPTIYREKYKGTGPADGLRILMHMIVWRFRG